jgi:hypothetical protein
MAKAILRTQWPVADRASALALPRSTSCIRDKGFPLPQTLREVTGELAAHGSK